MAATEQMSNRYGADVSAFDVFGCCQVPLNEYDFPQSKLASVQAQLERLVEKNYYLHQSARDAYRCAQHSLCQAYQAPSAAHTGCYWQLVLN